MEGEGEERVDGYIRWRGRFIKEMMGYLKGRGGVGRCIEEIKGWLDGRGGSG